MLSELSRVRTIDLSDSIMPLYQSSENSGCSVNRRTVAS